MPFAPANKQMHLLRFFIPSPLLAWARCRSALGGLVLAFAAVLWTSGYVAGSQTPSTALTSFDHCISGSQTASEAEQVGQTLTKRYYNLFFDSSIFSTACAAAIARNTFGNYGEAASLQLVSFFWNEAFFNRLYEISTNASHPNCALSCLLQIDHRPLPDLSLFDRLIDDIHGSPASVAPFLIARSLANKGIDPDQLGRFLDRSGALEQKVLERLFLLADSEDIRKEFHEESDPHRICTLDRCVPVDRIHDINDCETFDHDVQAVGKNIERAIAVKSWTFYEGQKFIRNCVERSLRGPLETMGQTSVASVYALSLFNPEIQLSDLVNGFRAGTFIDFDFIDRDISRLSNLSLPRLQSLSSSFARRILDQLDTPSAVAAVAGVKPLDALLRTSPWVAARYEYLVCRNQNPSLNIACNRRAIYLSAILHSL